MQDEVQTRVLVLLLAAVAAAAAAGWSAIGAGGAAVPATPLLVSVGGTPLPAEQLRAAPDRAIERRWLLGEAAARGLTPAGGLRALRGQVADAVAGAGEPPTARRLAAAFGAFHRRWRERTRCAPAYREPHADRCGGVAPVADGVCRWLGEATVCGLAGGDWLVVRPPRPGRARTLRVRSRGRALAVARADYLAARRERARAAARERAAARAAADRRAGAGAQAAGRSASDRRAAARAGAAAGRRAAARATARRRADAALRASRAHDPELAGGVLAAARAACERQVADSEPYLFGFGMQDVVGQAEGLIAARTALAGRLRAAASGAADRDRLGPLLRAIAAGSRELGALAAADVAGDRAAVAARVARFDERTAPERAASRRLGLGDCLVRPAR
jgi:hypothetical protein